LYNNGPSTLLLEDDVVFQSHPSFFCLLSVQDQHLWSTHKIAMLVSLRTATTALLGLLSVPAVSAYTNPIRNPGGSDPQIVWSGGYYYLLSTTWTDVQIARADTVAGLKTAEKKVVYSTTEASRACNVWAPEVHYLGGAWYVYYTAGNCDDLGGQRLHVLRGGATPWDEYSYAAQLSTEWAIDASVLRFAEHGNFLVFSCFHGGLPNQSTCLQQLGDDFVSVTGDIHVISKPTEEWESSGTPVQEGQNALYLGGRTFIVYSASYCWTPDYCLGSLEWNGAGDPTAETSWTKSSQCLLKSANGNYGTGHNSFFMSPSGNETWNAFHATSNSAGACDDSRYAMVQPVGLLADGRPDFGTPAVLAEEFVEPI
jgi:GH43 family beta-xylosidase